MKKLDWYEAQEVADILTKIDNPDQDVSETENAIVEKWGISLEDFHEIVSGVFEMIDFGISPITQEGFVGIADGNAWIAKKEVNNQFISAIINWATEGEDIPEGQKGFLRTITSNGVPEFDITITRAEPKQEEEVN